MVLEVQTVHFNLFILISTKTFASRVDEAFELSFEVDVRHRWAEGIGLQRSRDIFSRSHSGS